VEFGIDLNGDSNIRQLRQFCQQRTGARDFPLVGVGSAHTCRISQNVGIKRNARQAVQSRS